MIRRVLKSGSTFGAHWTGNKANESVLNSTGDTAQQIANLALFSNVRSDFYWSGTEFAPLPSLAWSFGASSGFLSLGSKRGSLYAVAVLPGDVTAFVPEPQTYALLLGLGVMVASRRRPR